MPNEVLEFGQRLDGQTYVRRPGSYGVFLRDDECVAVVRVNRRIYLPGGGAEPGESPEQTLQREVMEECGCQVDAMTRCGFAVEYVFVRGEGYFAKESTFFFGTLGVRVSQRSAADYDHELRWLKIPTAIEELQHKSQSWAVAGILGSSPLFVAGSFLAGECLVERSAYPHE